MSLIDFSKFFKLLANYDMTSNQQDIFGRQITNMESSIISDKIGPNISSPYQAKGEVVGINGSFDGGNYWVNKANKSTYIWPTSTDSGFSIDFLCGINISGDQAEKFYDVKNIWESITTSPYYHGSSMCFTLTYNIGMICGGLVSGTFSRKCNSLTDSTKTWATKTDLAGDFDGLAEGFGASLTSDLGFSGGGANIAGTQTANFNRFSLSSNAWLSRTAINYLQDLYPSSFSLTSDTISISGGQYTTPTNITRKYRDSTNLWSSTTNYPISVYGHRSCEFTSNGGISTGGVSTSGYGTVIQPSFRFSDSNSTWTSRNQATQLRYGFASFSLDNNHGAIFGGGNVSYNLTTEVYYDGCSYLSLGNSLNSFEFKEYSISVVPTTISYLPAIVTNTLKSQVDKITNILVSGIYSKADDTQNPSYGVSLDDGITWKDGIGFDIPTQISGLKPSDDGIYNLKLKFNLFRSINSNTWTSKTNSPSMARRFASGFSLSPDVCLISGGANASGVPAACTSVSESISDITNSWTSKTSHPVAQVSYPMGITLSNDLGILAGGSNYTSCLSSNYGFSNSSNIWATKMSLTGQSRYGCATLSMTTNLGILAGGQNINVLNYVDVFSNSSNTWTNINSMRSLCQISGISLTTNLGLICGGENSPTTYAYNTEFKLAENTLVDKTAIPYTIHGFATYSLTSDIGIISGGSNGSYGVGPTNATRFSYSTNVWTSLTSMSEIKDEPSGITIDSYSGLTILGASSPSTCTTSCFKYCLAETDFLGFYCLTS